MSGRRTLALGAAAIREAYEETGFLIGGPADGNARPPADWRAFFAHGLAPDLSGLRFFMRAITPPGRTRRFDNRFFAVDAARIAKSLPAADCPTEELEERRFIAIDEALAMEVPRVTAVALQELKTRLSAKTPFEDTRPVPFYRMVHREAPYVGVVP